MTSLYSVTVVLSLTFSLAISGCNTRTTGDSQTGNIHSTTSLPVIQRPDSTNNSAKQKEELTKIYSQAIADYISLVNKEYKLRFDTLFFGKHVIGQPDDFPDIELPASIKNTKIILISPDEGEKIQKERISSFYINLIGWANGQNADFIFVTFSNGFAHQFDCFINYSYDSREKKYVIETTRFKKYRYNTK